MTIDLLMRIKCKTKEHLTHILLNADNTIVTKNVGHIHHFGKDVTYNEYTEKISFLDNIEDLIKLYCKSIPTT